MRLLLLEERDASLDMITCILGANQHTTRLSLLYRILHKRETIELLAGL